MKKLPANSNPFGEDEPTHIGLDIAVNRDKGLRCVIQTPSGVWEVTLRFNNKIHLCKDFPFLDLPQSPDGLSPAFLMATFNLTSPQAESLSQAFRRAACVAIDAPPALAVKGHRQSEVIWNEHTIRGIKDGKGGVFWTPTEAEIPATVTVVFTDPQSLTTEQVTKLGQSLWMFVGFWAHQEFQKAGIQTIEVFPAALLAMCKDILGSKQGPELEADHKAWAGGSEVPEFPGTKSESNDAALACFTAWLHSNGKTQELSAGEIVVPMNRERPCQTQTGKTLSQSQISVRC